jgi:predicted nuclease of predicted toxin-antitoxin system
MKFFVDAHFSVRLKHGLNDHGEDALHTSDLPKGNQTPDKEIIAFATEEARIVITKDHDFIEYRIIHQQPDQLLMISTGNIANRELIALFEVNFPTIKELFQAGNR